MDSKGASRPLHFYLDGVFSNRHFTSHEVQNSTIPNEQQAIGKGGEDTRHEKDNTLRQHVVEMFCVEKG